MVEESHLEAPYNWSNSSEDSVIRRPEGYSYLPNKHGTGKLKMLSSDQLGKIAASARSDTERVHLLIQKQEVAVFEIKQAIKVRQAKNFLSRHGIVIKEDVHDGEACLRPIDKIDITDIPVKKVYHMQKPDREAGTVY